MPVRLTVSGVALALLVILQVPESVPELAGVNAMLVVQLADTPSVEPQVVERTEKSVGSESTAVLSVTELAVLLVTVMIWAVLVDPTFVVPNDRLPGVADTTPAGAVPRPVRETCWGLALSLSLKFKVAVRVPEVVGLKTMVAVQLAEAATVVPQVFERTPKSAGFVPVIPMLFMVMAALPEFVSVTVFSPLWLPTATLFHESEVGETMIAPPVPLSATVSGVELALLVMLQVPESVPDVEGANAMFAVQLADAASVEVQVVEEAEKSVGSESAPVLSVTELAELLVTVMV